MRVTTKIEHRSKVKVKVTENTKTTIWAITFEEPEVVETSGWFQNVPCQNTYQKWRTTYRFCVTWRQIKYTIVAYFLTSSILNRLISKSVHTLIWLCTIYNIKNCTNKNNIPRITMETKYPIIKHRAFFKTLIAAYHPFILDGFLWNFAYEISLK